MEEAGRAREASRRWTMSGLTAEVGAAASINDINNIAAFPPGTVYQPGALEEVAKVPTNRPKRPTGRAGYALATRNDIIYHVDMDAAARLFGSGSAAIGTLLQLAVIAATLPRPRECPNDMCVITDSWPVEVDIWGPFIDNIDDGGTRNGLERRCPGPRSPGTAFRLDHAPLPAAFQRFGREPPVFACVRVGADGSIGAVRMIAGTGEARLDRQLTETIRRQWRFEPLGPRVHPGWQRIRLSS